MNRQPITRFVRCNAFPKRRLRYQKEKYLNVWLIAHAYEYTGRLFRSYYTNMMSIATYNFRCFEQSVHTSVEMVLQRRNATLSVSACLLYAISAYYARLSHEIA